MPLYLGANNNRVRSENGLNIKIGFKFLTSLITSFLPYSNVLCLEHSKGFPNACSLSKYTETRSTRRQDIMDISGAIHKAQHEVSTLRYLVLHEALGSWGKMCSRSRLQDRQHEDRLIMYSSLLYSSTGVHKTEESVWGLILRKEANVRM